MKTTPSKTRLSFALETALTFFKLRVKQDFVYNTAAGLLQTGEPLDAWHELSLPAREPGQIKDAKRVVKKACELDPDLRLVVLDHPGLEAIWWP